MGCRWSPWTSLKEQARVLIQEGVLVCGRLSSSCSVSWELRVAQRSPGSGVGAAGADGVRRARDLNNFGPGVGAPDGGQGWR